MSLVNLPEPKTYISNKIKSEFFNSSNLKYDIQNRTSNETAKQFYKGLNDMQGDCYPVAGVSFSEITRLALAYFFNDIFKHPKKDSYYTINMVKGFLDCCNLSPYTATRELDVKYYALTDAPLFNECWLIIQSAWFFNSEYFGKHQHVDYLNHYATTGEKLPTEYYKGDIQYLEKKYTNIDSQKGQYQINGFTFVNHWYYGILFLICKELRLSTQHFNITIKDNREYNPLPKVARVLRPLAPFLIVECDIKSAFPTFIDKIIDSNLKDFVYNNLMRSKGISRNEAKVLFNTMCNSGAYKSKAETKYFFIDCGYTEQQATDLLKLTHDPHIKFISFMTEHESHSINNFADINALFGYGRLHDAILLIYRGVKPKILTVNKNCEFGYKELNKVIYSNTFGLSDTRLKFAYISSIPKGLPIVNKWNETKPSLKGIASGFKFYKQTFNYISASFNINDYKAGYEDLSRRTVTMFNTLHYLNKKRIKPELRLLIIQHIRANSQYIFNVKYLYLESKNDTRNKSDAEIKKRNWELTEELKFKKRIDFLTARSEAECLVNIDVNYLELFDLLSERIVNNDYAFLNENLILFGRKSNNILLRLMVRKFNMLCTGRQRKPRKKDSGNILYIDTIKDVTIKSISSNNQTFKANATRQKAKQERIEKEQKTLFDNREIARQMFLILCDIIGQKNELKLTHTESIQDALKMEFISVIDKVEYTDKIGVQVFDYCFMKQVQEVTIKQMKSVSENYDTDLSKSIFNNISIEEASYRGEKFFSEYQNFHLKAEIQKPKKICKQTFVDISMQKESSTMLSHTGLQYYYLNDRNVFDLVAQKHLPKQYIKSDLETRIMQIAKSVRTKNCVANSKQIINQFNLF